jgi:hypothetical protein
MRPLARLALISLLLFGCKRRAPEPPPPARPAHAGPASTTGRLDAIAVRTEALALLGRWLDTQNKGDLKGYLALYEPDHFVGIKRALKQKYRKFDFAGWKADREALFKTQPTVAAERPVVETWLDPKSLLRPGVSQLRFTQRWKNAHYSDHGTKVLALWRDAQGHQHIVYEDLLSSLPGFDDVMTVPVKVGEVLHPPRSDAEAMALWRRIAPTVADHASKLGSISDPAVTRPLALTIVRGGNFACKDFTEYTECGVTSRQWNLLAPSAGLDSPCLRRLLALWALTQAALRPTDVSSILPRLVEIMHLPSPEHELKAAALQLASGAPAAERWRLVEAAVQADEKDMAAGALGGLPDEYLARAYREYGFDEAVLGMDALRNGPLIAQALSDDNLRRQTRLALFDRLPQKPWPGLAEQLGALSASDDDCEIAMRAGLASLAYGDASRLPRRPPPADTLGTEARHLAETLCRAAFDPDDARQLGLWREMLPPTGSIRIHRRREVRSADPDEDDDVQDVTVGTLSRAEARAFGLPWGFLDDCEPDEEEVTCTFNESATPGEGVVRTTFEVIFRRANDGRVYISEMGMVERQDLRWACGC